MKITEFLSKWQDARNDAHYPLGMLLPDDATVCVLEGSKPAREITDLEMECNPDGRIIMWIKIGD